MIWNGKSYGGAEQDETKVIVVLKAMIRLTDEI